MLVFQRLDLHGQTRHSLQSLTLSKDTNPITYKIGIRSHALPVAIVLKLLSILRLVSGIISIPTASGTVYLNKGSFEKWCRLHRAADTTLSPLERIHRINRLAIDQLNRTPDVPASISQQPLPDHQEATPSASLISCRSNRPLAASADPTDQNLSAAAADLTAQVLPTVASVNHAAQNLAAATPVDPVVQSLQAASALPQSHSKEVLPGHTAQTSPAQASNQLPTRAASPLLPRNDALALASEPFREPVACLPVKPPTPCSLDEATLQVMLDQFDQLILLESSPGLRENPVWNEAMHKAALAKGHMQFERGTDSLNRPSMHITIRRSYAKGSGFGTASMRHIVEASFKNDFQGRVHNEAAWSSHVFHHYMGMEPVDREIDYLTPMYGCLAKNTVQARHALLEKLQSKTPLSTQDHMHCRKLLIILKVETGNKGLVFSEQLLIDYEQLLQALETKTASYLQMVYFQRLLEILERDGEKELPDTNSLASVRMHLSDIAIARWKEAIDNKRAFIPFKDFEHLRLLMTAEQKSRLDTIVEKRKAYKKRQPFLKFLAIRDRMSDSQRALLDERLSK